MLVLPDDSQESLTVCEISPQQFADVVAICLFGKRTTSVGKFAVNLHRIVFECVDAVEKMHHYLFVGIQKIFKAGFRNASQVEAVAA